MTPDRSSPELAARLARRAFLSRSSLGLGSLALATLLRGRGQGAELARADQLSRGVVHPLHFAPRAKRVIFLYMSGGPSHLDLFDYKPELEKHSGEPMPESFTKGQPIAQLQGATRLQMLGPQFKFGRYGASGQHLSTALPHIGGIADEICIVRSLVTEAINHDPAHTFMNTGTTISGRPSMGSWVWYGLGAETESLPGFVVLTSHAGRNPQPISNRMWHNGFLPGSFQGVKFNSQGDPVEYLRRPQGVTSQQQRDIVTAVGALNQEQRELMDDPEIATRISQYEMAFKMQTSIPDLVDFSGESQSTLDLYGCTPGDGSFASNCLLARRMAERGVRFIQIYQRGWDHHNDVKKFIGECAGAADQASAALVADLKQRGMLDETLIVWGGEFGRTPMAQGGKGPTLGRDHHMKGFSMWLAGGGIRGGISHGATDELGYNSCDNIVHVHDLHATMLHLLGIDHERLNVRSQGRDFRLTDVKGEVVRGILG